MFKLFFLIAALAGSAWAIPISSHSQTAAVPTPSPWPWGTALSEFRTVQKSRGTFTIEPLHARALDYLLMEFHEVGRNDPSRAPKFSVQVAPGDPALYVFYGGKLCAVSKPVKLPDFGNVRKALESKLTPSPRIQYADPRGFEGDHGSMRVFFHYTPFSPNPGTSLYLVEVTGYYDDDLYYGEKQFDLLEAEEGERLAGFLVWVSGDYLQGGNAYSDWLEIRKNPLSQGNVPLRWFKAGIGP